MPPPARSSRPPLCLPLQALKLPRQRGERGVSHPFVTATRQVPRGTLRPLRRGDTRDCFHPGPCRRTTRRRPRGSLGGRAAARGSCSTRTAWRWTGRAMSSSRTTANTASSSSPQRGGWCGALGGWAAALASCSTRAAWDGHVDVIPFNDILKLIPKSWSKPRDSSNEEALNMPDE